MRVLVAYLCDLALPDLTAMRFAPSLRAAAAVLLARKVSRSTHSHTYSRRFLTQHTNVVYIVFEFPPSPL